MESIAKLEASVMTRPNSIEINHALAEAYIQQGRWKEATETYQTLISLYPATASLFVDRIRLGAAALAISSFFILLAQSIQPFLRNVQTNPSDLSLALTSSAYLFAQILFLLAFPLFSTAAISIYKLLSYSRDHRLAFAAMVFSVIGVGLSMPALGINAVVLPLIGKIYLGGEAGALSLYLALQNYPQLLILKLGGYLLVIGIAVFSWVIWRNEILSKWGAMSYLVGWILFVVLNDRLSTAGLFSSGLMIALGGITLARAIWIQAPLQFTPTSDPTQKADL